MTDNSIEFNVNTIFNDNINVTDPYNISISDVNIANNPTSKSAVNAQSVVNYLTPLISELNDNISNGAFATSGLSSPGYQIFPNGLIMQWCSKTVNAGIGTWSNSYHYPREIVYFPIAFPHQCLHISSNINSSTPSSGCDMSNGCYNFYDTIVTYINSTYFYAYTSRVGPGEGSAPTLSFLSIGY